MERARGSGMAEDVDKYLPNDDSEGSPQPSPHAQPQKACKEPRYTTHVQRKSPSPKMKNKRRVEAPGRGGCKRAAVSKADRTDESPQPDGCSRLRNGSSAPNDAPTLQACRRRTPLQKSENTQETAREGVCCPECGSAKVWRDGLRYTSRGAIQRYLCRSCGYRFSETKVKLNVFGQFLESPNSKPNLGDKHVVRGDFPIKEIADPLPLKRGEDVASQSTSLKTGIGKGLYVLSDYNRKRRVCDGKGPSKNPASQAGRGMESAAEVEKRVAGATVENSKGRLIQFIWELKKQGLTDETIRTYHYYLEQLLKRGANLLDPESVKEVIATQKWSRNTKALAIASYTKFLQVHGGTWTPPRIKRERKLPFIPLESELDQLISGANKKLATFLQLLKETGMRSGEAWKLKWTDVDFKNQTLILNEPEKFGTPRMFKLSSQLISMLNLLPKNSERIFTGKLSSLRRVFAKHRKRMALKLQNPRLKRITFHTFRHWKATMEYHKTKDLLYVKELLGHRDIKTTLIYTQLIKFEGEDEYYSATAKTTEEAEKLVEVGFEYVCTTPQNVMLFRKRK